VLLAESNHRVKNVLATVQSIAAQTLRGSASLEEFGQAFEGRLEALSRTSTLLAVHRWRATELRALVEAALEPYRAPGGNVHLEGPGVTLSPKTALTLSLVLHELATNAAKYGALSVPQGRVEVTWANKETAEGRHLSLAWTEHDGPEVRTSDRRGFGRRLIERSVAYELDGSAELEFAPTGVRCRIELPLNDEA
jgi:two-component sensor histidine kinase